MLWHPVSLHDPAAAADRAAELLAGMARYVPGAPDDPEVIAAEVADLLDGDVPYFRTTPRCGRLAGPRGTSWLPEQDLICAALDRWRTADFERDSQVIRAALVSAYLNDGWLPSERQLSTGRRRDDDLDRRRRRIAATLIRQLRDAAIRGEDGTVTWIAPVLGPTGWSVQPLSQDIYGGLPGLAVLLAAYQRERAAGRADDVGGVAALLNAVLRTIRAAEDKYTAVRLAEKRLRPPPVGGYIGLGSQIWAWLTLHAWDVAGPDGLDRARAHATQLPAAIAAQDRFDLLTGMSGAIVPLLQLASATEEAEWAHQAADIGERLLGAALVKDGTLRWPSEHWADGIGGFAHGATGIGWALARLALATGEARFADAAQAAFAFEETLYDPVAGAWADLRDPEEVVDVGRRGATAPSGSGSAPPTWLGAGWAGAAALTARAAAVGRQERARL